MRVRGRAPEWPPAKPTISRHGPCPLLITSHQRSDFISDPQTFSLQPFSKFSPTSDRPSAHTPSYNEHTRRAAKRAAFSLMTSTFASPTPSVHKPATWSFASPAPSIHKRATPSFASPAHKPSVTILRHPAPRIGDRGETAPHAIIEFHPYFFPEVKSTWH